MESTDPNVTHGQSGTWYCRHGAPNPKTSESSSAWESLGRNGPPPSRPQTEVIALQLAALPHRNGRQNGP
ncbi:hypothetical protein VNO77_37412 [Canavalia gladiata]|uniref:Uncharacterized protein n=1 Tax=Canavalia gladiata TaxID=3824 RepID=A0AAN9PWQ0_CANGL